jgi:VIT1/CCC1 family predicted Fe2+/Mn2+ transporter
MSISKYTEIYEFVKPTTMTTQIKALYMRNFIFGVEDSLVSTLGFLTGISAAGLPIHSVILSGLVLVLVEAFSMGVGSFLSEETVEEYEQRGAVPLRKSIIAGLTMFFSYLVAGFIPLGPYILLPALFAFWLSILFSLSALFLLGALSGKVSSLNSLKTGFRMLLIGGGALLIGIIVGMLVN